MAQNAAQDALFPDEIRQYPDGTMVQQVKQSILHLDAVAPIPGHRRVFCQIAVELARNIEAGNRKGRAIANEAMQLAATMQIIEGDQLDAATAESTLPADVMEFMRGIGTNPATASHPA